MAKKLNNPQFDQDLIEIAHAHNQLNAREIADLMVSEKGYEPDELPTLQTIRSKLRKIQHPLRRGRPSNHVDLPDSLTARLNTDLEKLAKSHITLSLKEIRTWLLEVQGYDEKELPCNSTIWDKLLKLGYAFQTNHKPKPPGLGEEISICIRTYVTPQTSKKLELMAQVRNTNKSALLRSIVEEHLQKEETTLPPQGFFSRIFSKAKKP